MGERLGYVVFFVMAGQKREARLRAGCSDHPGLLCDAVLKTWISGTRLDEAN
jgi:hypothetical protein